MEQNEMANRGMNNFAENFKDLDLPLHGVRLPSFDIDNKYKHELGVSEDINNYDFLRELCTNGFKKLGFKKGSKEYKEYGERGKYELQTLKDLGFIDYILLCWDVINFCNKNNIPTGLGRGSAAGSLVLYLIGVTKIDPVKRGLYFERFVSKIRAKKKVVKGITYLDGTLMCDVDLDICYYNRQRVIQYLEEKFEGKTSKILTLNTLSTKLLIKECGKIVGGKSEQEMNEVTSMIPKMFGIVKDLDESYEEVDKFKTWCDENSEVYTIALKLRGLIKNKGVHPSGMLLSYSPMDDSCPTELSSDKDSVSSYDMNWASLFNVKLDLLGLRGVSVAHDVCENVGIDMNKIDLEHPLIYQNLQDMKTPHGLFQIEADMAHKVGQQVKPKNLEELSAVLALARPGAMAYVKQYADYTNHDIYDPIHPFFDDILKETGGVALYQEQLMKMANKIGFTLDEAELLRRIVGKKKVSEVRKWKKKIKDKVKENNLDTQVSDVLWKILEDSANYSFNKSHSIAYAALAAITVYLKFKYPQQFFLSLLKMTRHEPDPTSEISKIQKELSVFDIRLLPPHLTKSDMDFIIEDKNIRYGLLSIKGISDKSIEKLNKFRNKYANKFETFQASKQAGLNVGALSALIQAGALQGFSQSRSKIVYEAQVWNILTEREKKLVMRFAEQYDYDLVSIVKKLVEFKDNDNKVAIKSSRYQTIKKKSEPYRMIYQLNSQSERFANWFYENKLLGYTYGIAIREIFSDKRPNLTSIREVKELTIGRRPVFIGTVEDIFSRVSKNQNKYIKLVITDEGGSIDVLMFNDNIKECKTMNNGLPEKGNIVIVKGTKKDESVFANLISIQDNKVYTKLSELKEA
jgi:DNA polymerase-3 subunit alpha